MRVLCKTVLFAVALSTGACHETSAPVQTGHYVLSAVDGRSLPTLISAAPQAPTVLSGAFQLASDGHASANELRRDFSGNEYTFSASYRYTISGNTIQFDYDPQCGGPAIDCARPPTGVISGDHLLIDYSGGNNTPIYDYQLLRLIDLPPG